MANYQLSITNPQTKNYLKICSLWSVVCGLYFKVCLVIVAYILVIGSSSLFAQNSSPERIISLGPAITRQLSLLGVEDRIVGVTTYCNIPQFENKERVGTLMEADLEKIVTLKPDLVIATALTNLKTIQRLKSLDIKVVVFDEAQDFKQLCEQFLSLASFVNREQIARDIILKVEGKVTNIKEKAKGLSKPKVIVQIGANPLWVATKSSLINDFVEMAGGEYIGPSGESGLISREYVLKSNPDVILIIQMGIAAEEEKEIWSKFRTINAVSEGRIHIIDSYGICSPTPLSFVDTLEEIFKLLHPEIE
jgi:ABC-type Fe3+-hydroxamate transport system substrate-binding protein